MTLPEFSVEADPAGGRSGPDPGGHRDPARAVGPRRLRAERPATAAHVRELRRAAVSFAAARGAGDDQQSAIAVAVTEAVTNSVLHAYAGAPAAGRVWVEAWVQDERLNVRVCDEGQGMRPRPDSPGFGLGLPMIAQLVERLDIESRGDLPGVCLRMVFPLRGEQAPG